MATNSELPTSMLVCRLCQSLPCDPRTLPCLHSFCFNCLHNLIILPAHQPPTTISCPVCGQVVQIPPEGVSGFTYNAFLERMSGEYVTLVQRGIVTGRNPMSPPPPQILQTSLSASDVLAAQSAGLNSQFQYPGCLQSPPITESRGVDGTMSPPYASPVTRSEPVCSSSSSSTSSTDIILQTARKLSIEMPLPSRGTGVERRLSSTPRDVVQVWESLQHRLASLQTASLRAAYSLETVNMAEAAWHHRKQDLKRDIQRRSAQLQFYIKRQERLLLAALASRATEDSFLKATDRARAQLRTNLKTLLHQTDILKSMLDLATDQELVSLSSLLLANSVFQTAVNLEAPELAFKVPEEVSLEEMVARDFGCLTSTTASHTVFTPEDFQEEKGGCENDQENDEAFLIEKSTPSITHCTHFPTLVDNGVEENTTKQEHTSGHIMTVTDQTLTTEKTKSRVADKAQAWSTQEDSNEFVFDTYTLETPKGINMQPSEDSSTFTQSSEKNEGTGPTIKDNKIDVINDTDTEDDDEEIVVEETFEIIDGKMQLVFKRSQPAKPKDPKPKPQMTKSKTAQESTTKLQPAFQGKTVIGGQTITTPVSPPPPTASMDTTAVEFSRGRGSEVRRTVNSSSLISTVSSSNAKSSKLSVVQQAEEERGSEVRQTVSSPSKISTFLSANTQPLKISAVKQTEEEISAIRQAEEERARIQEERSRARQAARAAFLFSTSGQQKIGPQQTNAPGHQQIGPQKSNAPAQEPTGPQQSNKSGQHQTGPQHSSTQVHQHAGIQQSFQQERQLSQEQQASTPDTFQQLRESLRQQRRELLLGTSFFTLPIHPAITHLEKRVQSLDRTGATRNQHRRSHSPISPKRRHALMATLVQTSPRCSDSDESVHGDIDMDSVSIDTVLTKPATVPLAFSTSLPPASGHTSRLQTSITAPNDRATSRPLRRVISSATDKASKMEYLRETWRRRKELLIMNHAYFTAPVARPEDDSGNLDDTALAATSASATAEHVDCQDGTRTDRHMMDTSSSSESHKLGIKQSICSHLSNLKQALKKNGKAEVGQLQPRERDTEALKLAVHNRQHIISQGIADPQDTELPGKIGPDATGRAMALMPEGWEANKSLNSSLMSMSMEAAAEHRVFRTLDEILQRKSSPTSPLHQSKSPDLQANICTELESKLPESQVMEGIESQSLEPVQTTDELDEQQHPLDTTSLTSQVAKPSLIVKPRVREPSHTVAVTALDPLQEDEKYKTQPAANKPRPGLRVTSPSRGDTDHEKLQQVRANIRRKKERWRSLSLQ